MNMNMNLRIKQRRKILGLTQEDLAQAVGVSQNAIHKLEDGSTKKPRNIIELSKVLQCDPNWLLFGDENGLPVELVPESQVNFLPLLEWEDISNWPDVNVPKNVKQYPCPIPCSSKSFVLTVKGISMEPTFSSGDLIFIEPDADAHHERFVVVAFNGEFLLRQLIFDGNDKFLRAINPNWPNQITPINEQHKIIGVVFFSCRNL